jgi:hypothetical protein
MQAAKEPTVLSQDPREDCNPRTPASRQTVLWVIALLLAVNATALILRPSGAPALPIALADTPMAGARGIFAFTGQIDQNRYGLFMLDVDTRNVWCYEYLPSTRKVRLVFTRSFDFDRYLEDYNNDKDTTPAMIRKMLEEQRRIKDRQQRVGEGEDELGSLGATVPGTGGDLDEAKSPATP